MPVRLTHTGDAAALPDIERAAGELFCTIPGLEWIADDSVMPVDDHLVLISQGTHWVSTGEDGQLTGFLAAEVAGDALHICEMSVHPAFQGQGSGRALMMAAIDHAEANGMACVTLSTFIDVPWNAPFYVRLGFDIIPPDMCNKRLAAILMQEAEHGLPPERRCAMQYRLLARSARAR